MNVYRGSLKNENTSCIAANKALKQPLVSADRLFIDNQL